MTLLRAHTWPADRPLSGAESLSPPAGGAAVDVPLAAEPASTVAPPATGPLAAGLRERLATGAGQLGRDAAGLRAPGVGGLPLSAAGPVDMTTYGWALTPPAALVAGAALGGDRAGGTLAAPVPGGGASVAASLYPDIAQLRLQGSPAGGISHLAAVQLEPHTLTPTLGAGHSLDGVALAGLSLGLRLEGQHRLRLLAVEDGTVVVEEVLRRASGLQLAGGVGHLALAPCLVALGVGGLWAESSGMTRTLRQVLPAAALAAWAGAPPAAGTLGSAAGFARAWGLAEPSLAWPHPADLAVGDSLTLAVEAGGHGGLGVAAAGVLAGRYTTWHRSRRLEVRRLGATLFEATLTHERHAATSWGLEVPMIGGLHAAGDHVVALAETFRFATDRPLGRQAYRAMRAGLLPEGARAAALLADDEPTAATLSQLAAALAAEVLPAGVTRGPLVLAARPRQRTAGGDIATPTYLPALLSRRRGSLSGSGPALELVATADEISLTERRVWQREAGLWAGGRHGTEVWAGRRRRLVAPNSMTAPRAPPIEHAVGATVWHQGAGGGAASRAALAAAGLADPAVVPEGPLAWRLSVTQPLPAAALADLAVGVADDGVLTSLAARLAAGGPAAVAAMTKAVSPHPTTVDIDHPGAAPLVRDAAALTLGLEAARAAGSLTVAQLGTRLGEAAGLAARLAQQRRALGDGDADTALAAGLEAAGGRLARLAGAVDLLDAQIEDLWRAPRAAGHSWWARRASMAPLA